MNEIRNGNFNSSEIVALLSEPTAKDKKEGAVFGKSGLTFIEECNMERRLGRSLTDESNARPLTWGKLLEIRGFDAVGIEYVLTSDVTEVHPEIPYWVGSKDGYKLDEGKTVIDFKCPMTLKSFCQLVQPLYDGLQGMDAMNVIRQTHKDGEKFFQQLVSNACIDGAKYAELIIYMPYQSELEEIREMARSVPADKLSAHYWIAFSQDSELPFLKDGGYYKNLNIIRFEVPQPDKELLTGRVQIGGKMLIPFPSPSILIASSIPEGVMVEGGKI